MRIKLISCISLDYDEVLLPHFMDHYSKLDIDSFHLILHSNKDFDLKKYNYLNVNLKLDKWVGIFDGVTKTNKFNNIIKESKEEYILLADVDEFQIWNINLKEAIKKYKAVWGTLRDRESKDKELIEVTSEELNKQFPLITKRTNWGSLDKPCLFPSSDYLLGPHNLKTYTNPHKDLIDIDHYRWIKGRVEKMIERKYNYRQLNKNKINSPLYKKLPNFDADQIIEMYAARENKTII